MSGKFHKRDSVYFTFCVSKILHKNFILSLREERQIFSDGFLPDGACYDKMNGEIGICGEAEERTNAVGLPICVFS